MSKRLYLAAVLGAGVAVGILAAVDTAGGPRQPGWIASSLVGACAFLGFLVAAWLGTLGVLQFVGLFRFFRHFRELSARHPHLYRVNALPIDRGGIVIAEGASIEIGDYGWQAGPLQNDDLTYLQGLAEDWSVVWYAGFRPDQIEVVGPKPRSQYALFRRRFPCPFPVQAREPSTLGETDKVELDRLAGQLEVTRPGDEAHSG